MTGAIRLPVPAAGADLCRYVGERVQAGDLDAALDRSVVEFDELAQFAGILVTAVETSGTAVAAHYTVAWTAFHACEDRHFGGEHARVLRGRVDCGEWLFDRLQPLPTQRDTNDEF